MTDVHHYCNLSVDKLIHETEKQKLELSSPYNNSVYLSFSIPHQSVIENRHLAEKELFQNSAPILRKYIDF